MQPSRDLFDVIVNYLPHSMDETMLQQLFSQAGEVMGLRIMRHNNGITRGFGFVSYRTKAEANRAIEMWTGFPIGRKILRVQHTRPRTSPGFTPQPTPFGYNQERSRHPKQNQVSEVCSTIPHFSFKSISFFNR